MISILAPLPVSIINLAESIVFKIKTLPQEFKGWWRPVSQGTPPEYARQKFTIWRSSHFWQWQARVLGFDSTLSSFFTNSRSEIHCGPVPEMGQGFALSKSWLSLPSLLLLASLKHTKCSNKWYYPHFSLDQWSFKVSSKTIYWYNLWKYQGSPQINHCPCSLPICCSFWLMFLPNSPKLRETRPSQMSGAWRRMCIVIFIIFSLLRVHCLYTKITDHMTQFITSEGESNH